MELKKLIEECSEVLQEAMNTGEYEAPYYGATVNTDNGYIDLSYYVSNRQLEVVVCHYRDIEIESPNLEKYLSEHIEVSMEEAREYWRDHNLDVWQANGFRDERDFWRWKEGRW